MMSDVPLAHDTIPPTATDSVGRSSWLVWASGALVVVLTMATFLPALRNGFVNWDDVGNFLVNPHYRGLGWANLRWMFTSVHLGHYTPITWLTLGLDYVLWGMNPVGYHLTSLLLHALNAVLFLLLAKRLLDLGSAPALRRDEAGAWLGAAVAALLFAVHPLRVESVAWITERRDVVSGLFFLLTVHAYLSACRRGEADRPHRGWYWTAVLLFLLALLSKSIVVGLPLVLIALDVYPLKRLFTATSAWPGQLVRLIREKTPFLLLSIGVTVLMLAYWTTHGLMTRLGALGPAARLALTGYALTFYLWKSLLPWPLSPLYELQYPVRVLSPQYLGPALVVLAITLGLVLGRRRWPAGLVAWIAYVVLLLPVIGIAHNGTQSVADRFSYLACLGWALLAGAGVSWCWKEGGLVVTRRLARLVLALSAVVVLGLSGLTILQIRIWHDDEALWRHALAVDPGGASAHYFLARVLAAQGRSAEARAEFELGVELGSDTAPNIRGVLHAGLGAALQRAGDLDGAERHYRAALGYSADNLTALNNLGGVQVHRGEYPEALESFRHVLRAIRGADPVFLLLDAGGLDRLKTAACSNVRTLAAHLRVTPKELETCPRPATEARPGTGKEISPSPAGHGSAS
jgi:hypothetical protein